MSESFEEIMLILKRGNAYMHIHLFDSLILSVGCIYFAKKLFNVDMIENVYDYVSS